MIDHRSPGNRNFNFFGPFRTGLSRWKKVEFGISSNFRSFVAFSEHRQYNRQIRPHHPPAFPLPSDSLLLEMDRLRISRQASVEQDLAPRFDDADDSANNEQKHQRSFHAESEDQEPFMGVKVRRKASLFREFRGDYLNVPSQPNLMNLIRRQGDAVYFADKVLKFTNSGKIKRRILIVTDSAIYIIDPETNALKRRITLVAVEMICLSKLNDNFFAIIIPTEYDLLMASMRKTEIVGALVDATKSTSNYEIDVQFSNRFVYHATAEVQKEILFEEAEGGIKTRILTK